jgi:translation initiation factor 3 subunit E
LGSDNSFTLAGLTSRGVSDANVAALYKLAKLNFDAGLYAAASLQLQAVIRLTADDSELRFSALWGKLSTSIMMVKSEDAFEDLKALREVIDKRGGSDLTALQQRTWLIHWSLFIFPHLDNGKVQLIEWLMEPKYIAATCTLPRI